MKLSLAANCCWVPAEDTCTFYSCGKELFETIMNKLRPREKFLIKNFTEHWIKGSLNRRNSRFAAVQR